MTANGGKPKNNGGITSDKLRINSEDKQRNSNARPTAKDNHNSARNRNSGACRISVVRSTTNRDVRRKTNDGTPTRNVAIRNHGRPSANGRSRKTAVD